MTKKFKFAITIVLVVSAAVGLALASLRARRSVFAPPAPLKHDLAEVHAGFVYSFAANVQTGIILIDAGQDPQGHAVLALIESLGARPDNVTDIFLTHAHGDHLAAVNLFPHAHVWAGQQDVALAAQTAAQASALARIFSVLMPTEPVVVTDPLRAEARWTWHNGTSMRAIAVPGHTLGSYVFLYGDVLFVGDVMRYLDNKLILPPAPFDADSELNQRSLLALRDTLQGVHLDRVCAAHGGCTPPGAGRAQFDAFMQELQR